MKRSRLAMASQWPLGVALAVVLAAGTAEGQTQLWTKYVDNPVLEHGEPGDWDEGAVDHSEVIFDGAMYHMWYAGGLAVHETDIGYATSDDGVTWIKHGANPVLLRGAPGEWDAGFLQPGAVLWDGALYHMWYGAGPPPGGGGTPPHRLRDLAGRLDLDQAPQQPGAAGRGSGQLGQHRCVDHGGGR